MMPSRLELGNELLVRDSGLLPALGYDRQIFQILQQLLVVQYREDDSGAFSALIGQVLNWIAHRADVTAACRRCREASTSNET